MAELQGVCKHCGEDIHYSNETFDGKYYWFHSFTRVRSCSWGLPVYAQTGAIAEPKGMHADPLVMEVLNG